MTPPLPRSQACKKRLLLCVEFDLPERRSMRVRRFYGSTVAILLPLCLCFELLPLWLFLAAVTGMNRIIHLDDRGLSLERVLPDPVPPVPVPYYGKRMWKLWNLELRIEKQD
ncbi:expressed unknown protein [Seminavis robusta]|uniref:Transmembrane protein n=1 Tax=Seminavis robusta TaxID=568900 RepID=A0A9N8F3Q4_9STRA|nr:expressed unknown protein [Seminavis robusta]|eukprot:Sro3063_g343011.1  (112) ;mRNA; r:3989-4324